jgi:hypothetical protein
MRTKIISPEEGEELARLHAELEGANKKTAALLTPPPTHRLEGEGLRQFIEAEDKVGAIHRRIRGILDFWPRRRAP